MEETITSEGNIFIRFIKRNWSWMLSAAITALFMLVVMVVAHVRPYGFRSFTMVDSMHQYVPFFSEFQNKLNNGGSMFYTWDIGMGQNFLSLYLYYLASPLNLLVAFVSRKSILAFMSLLIKYKIVFSAGAFSFFLSRRKESVKNNTLITAMGVAFALNNYICGYFWNIMWLDCIMVFPLIILGFERMMTKKDPRLYIGMLFYSMFCNYYISFIICIFLVLWFLAYSHKTPKRFFANGLRFAGASLLAAGMAALSLLIAYIAIMKTSTAGAAMPKWSWYQNILEILKRQFFMTKAVKMDPFDGNANLYCGTLAYMLILVYIFSNRIRLSDKIKKVLLLVFLIVSMNQELLNFIWHGFHNQFGIPNRFSFLYIFTILYLGYEAIIRIRKTNIYLLLGAISSSIALLVVCYFITGFDGQKSNEIMLLMSLLLIGFYGVILILRRFNILSIKVSTIIMATFLVSELFVNSAYALAKNGFADGDFYLKYADLMQETVSEVRDKASRDGHVFYREDIIEPIMMDENTFDNMKSLGTFCSTANGKLVNTMGNYGYYAAQNEYLYRGGCSVTDDLFGIRYIYVRDGEYYTYEGRMKEALSKEGITVYENDSALPISYGVNSEIRNFNYTDMDCANNLNRFVDSMTGTKDLFTEVQPYYAVVGTGCDASFNYKSPNLISYGNGTGENIYISIIATIESDGDYYFNVRGNYLDEMEYYLNDELVTGGRNQSQLFGLGELKAGDVVKFKIKFGTSYTPSGTVSTYMYTLNKDKQTEYRAKLMKNAMLVSEMDDDHIKGNINLDDDQIVFTSVPYDEGWTVYVDGKKTEPLEIAGAFIGIDAGKGKHEIEFRYVPKGFKTGLIISSISWIIYIALFVIIKKRNKRKKKSL